MTPKNSVFIYNVFIHLRYYYSIWHFVIAVVASQIEKLMIFFQIYQEILPMYRARH